MFRKLLHPLAVCLVLGLGIAWVLNSQKPPPEIVVTNAQIDQLQTTISQQFGGSGSIDRQQLLEQIAEEEILYLEAKALGLDKTQAVITRLANVAVFLQLVPEDSSLDERYRAALAMKLDETDIVVRRQMVTLLKTQLRNSTRVEEPSDSDIASYYRENPEKFSRPERFAFVHIYGESKQNLLESTDSTLANDFTPLGKSDEHRRAAIALGDVFYGGHQFNLQSEQQIARHFGHQFASAIPGLTVGQWSDTIESAFGWHRV